MHTRNWVDQRTSSLLITPLLLFSSRIEGVFCRIRQKLQQYNVEPVTATIKDYVAGAKVDTVNKQD